MKIHKQSVCLGRNLYSAPSLRQGYVTQKMSHYIFLLEKDLMQPSTEPLPLI